MKSDRCVATAPLIIFFHFYWNWYSPPLSQHLKTHTNTNTHINLLIHQIKTPDALRVASLHEATPQHRIHCLVWIYLVYARSAGLASLSGRYADGRSCWLIRESPAVTPEPHVLSSTVDYSGGRIPAMRRALHGSCHASSWASPRIPRVLFRGERAGGSEPGVSILMGACIPYSLVPSCLVAFFSLLLSRREPGSTQI